MIKSIIIAALVALLAPKGASAQGVPELECSCSPRTFQFVISLDPPLCDTNNIESNSGISVATTACFIEVPGLVEGIKQGDDDITFDELQPDFVVQNITSITFKESNKDGDEISKIVLNYGIPLKDGDKVNIFSASSMLDPSHSLEDQMNNVPYFVEIRLFGYNAEGELISNIIRWTYDLSCESDPIQTGDTIGWITFVSSHYVADVCDLCTCFATSFLSPNSKSKSIRITLKGHGHNSARQNHHLRHHR